MRSVLELAGFENMLSKIMGSNNKLNNALATIKALSSYKHSDHFNSRVVKKGALETSDEKAEAKEETPTVVKEIQEKKVAEEKKAPAKAVAKPAVKKTVKKD
ncbi:MAG: hypothetical protein WCH65_06200 [bacterium]